MASTDGVEVCKLQQNEAEATIEDQSKEEKPKTNPETTIEDDESEVEKPKTWPGEVIVLDDADRKLREESRKLGLYSSVFSSGAIIDDRGYDGPVTENFREHRVIGYDCNFFDLTDDEDDDSEAEN